MVNKWYDKNLKQIENKLKSNIKTGLTRKAVASRIKINGKNIIYPIPEASFFTYLKHILTDFISILLILTSIIAAIFEQDISAIVIVVTLFINYGASVFTYVKAQRVLEGMGHFSLPTATVIREGKIYLVKQQQLVHGDIIYISPGDIVPSDARLIKSENLTILETNLTSEVKASQKDAEFIEHTNDLPPSMQKNMIFASTIVTNGTGKAIVCEIGKDTLVCRLKKNFPIITHENLKILSTLKKYCGVWSLCMIGVIFIITVVDLIMGIRSRGLFNIFFTGLSLAVASMSELYIAFGYIIIACGIFNAVQQKKDINKGALIKNTSKLDIIKDITCIIIPKEGVFALNEFKIEKIYTNGEMLNIGDKQFNNKCNQILKYATISTGFYDLNKPSNEDRTYTPEEEAIILTAGKNSLNRESLERNYPILAHEPISDRSKFDTTLVNFNNNFIVSIRGEAKKVLSNCIYYSENGRVLNLNNQKKSELLFTSSRLSKETYRVIAVASKNSVYNNLMRLNACQSDLIFEGFIAMREPLMPGVAKIVSKCQNAGIKIVMMCEDVRESDHYLAESMGIVKNSSEIITSTDYSFMKQEVFRTNIPNYRLYSGFNVQQKLLVLKQLQQSGEIVGILGRELDDIALLNDADVGISQSITISGKSRKNGIDLTEYKEPIYKKLMQRSGKHGCEALKFISDIVISGADITGGGGFNAIIGAISSAKVIYKNIIRMVRYLMTSQFARFFIVLYSVMTHDNIFTPVQILFCGLIVDFVAVIIISFEKPSNDILSQVESTEYQLANPFKHNMQSIIFGLFWAVTTVVTFKLLQNYNIIASEAELMSFVFISFIITQIVALNETIKEKSVFVPNIKFNRIYTLTLGGIIVFITLSVLIKPMGALFNIVPMNVNTWIATIIIPTIIMLTYEILKFINKKNT